MPMYGRTDASGRRRTCSSSHVVIWSLLTERRYDLPMLVLEYFESCARQGQDQELRQFSKCAAARGSCLAINLEDDLF